MPRPALIRSLAVLGSALLLLVGGVGAGTANAKEAVIYPPQNCRYLTASYGTTCFAWGTDDQWINDVTANGWAPVVHVQTNYDKNRYCQARPAAEGWNYCEFDHVEGKCVRFQMYELKGDDKRNHTAWSPWYGTEYGSPC